MARAGEECELSESVNVDCTAEEAWSLFTNNRTVTAWAPHVVQVACEHDTIDEGVVRTSTIQVDGKEGQTVEHCTLANKPHRLDYNIVEETFGFAHMLTRYGFSVVFDANDTNTTVTMHTRFTPKKIFARVMTSASTKQTLTTMMRETLAGFKQHAESSR